VGKNSAGQACHATYTPRSVHAHSKRPLRRTKTATCVCHARRMVKRRNKGWGGEPHHVPRRAPVKRPVDRHTTACRCQCVEHVAARKTELRRAPRPPEDDRILHELIESHAGNRPARALGFSRNVHTTAGVYQGSEHVVLYITRQLQAPRPPEKDSFRERT
jgi:hypothetical protein